MTCDLAETYQIYDYKRLPPTKVAVFAVGLRDGSRIKMKLSGKTVSLDTLLTAGIVDRLGVLVWAQTKDGQKGKNKPTMIVESLVTKGPKETDIIICNSGEDFKKRRNELIKGKEAIKYGN